MAQHLLIDASHPEETRVAVVDDGRIKEFEYESTNKQQITGNIYLARVVRVEPSLQAVFVEYGGNRHGFLAFPEIHPHYYNIPVADKQAATGNDDDPESPDDAGQNAAGDDTNSAPAPDDQEPDAGAGTAGDGGDGGAGTAGDGAGTAENGGDADEGGSDAAAGTAGEGGDDDEPGDDDVDEEDIARPRPPVRRYRVQEVIRQKQLVLVQILKDERGNKGAALTTYISLAGRYCVLMPNTDRGGGISRKITNAVDRRKLKSIVSDIDLPEGVGLIIRTAGANRTKQEIKRDYEYLVRQWDKIREFTFKSAAPALIHDDGGLIKRTIRDDYSKGVEEVIVEGEEGYKSAKNFMKMIMPSHAKRVKKHVGPLPLFAKFGIEKPLSNLFEPSVPLPSGGYIVIGITEALVAIDVNSGRSTSHGSLEQTALQTNLEAAEVIAEQLRLRDLAGLIVIDFIDMDEGKNNSAVEKRFKECLKADRSKIQTGRITGFGLLEMSRQRLRPGLQELVSQPCETCNGTGVVRADDWVALDALRHIEQAATGDSGVEIIASAPVAVANIILNRKRATLTQMEDTHSITVSVEGSPDLSGSELRLRRITRRDPESDETREEIISIDTDDRSGRKGKSSGEHGSESRRRRRRSQRGSGRRGGQATQAGAESDDSAAAAQEESGHDRSADKDGKPEDRKGRRKRRRGGSRKSRTRGESEVTSPESVEDPGKQEMAEQGQEQSKPPRKRRRGGRKKGQSGKGTLAKDSGMGGSEADSTASTGDGDKVSHASEAGDSATATTTESG